MKADTQRDSELHLHIEAQMLFADIQIKDEWIY